MDHFFLRNEVGGFAHKLHECVDVVRPVIENVIRVLGLSECDDALEAVDLGRHRLVHDQVGEVLFYVLPKLK